MALETHLNMLKGSHMALGIEPRLHMPAVLSFGSSLSQALPSSRYHSQNCLWVI